MLEISAMDPVRTKNSIKVTVYSVLINIHNKQYYLLELLQRHK